MASPTVHQPISPNANDSSKAGWMKKLDQEAFIRAQQEAFHAFQMAKALKLSKETAATEEEKRRSTQPPKPVEPERNSNTGGKRKRSDTVVSFNPAPSTSAASAATPPVVSGPSSTPAASNATPIPVTAPQVRGRRVSIRPSHAPAPSSTTLPAHDDAAARSLARSRHPDNVPQTPNNISSSPPKSTTVSKTTHHTSNATKSTTSATGPATVPQPIPNPSSQPSLISTTRPSRTNTIPSSTGIYHYSSSSVPNNQPVSKSATQTTTILTTPRNEPQSSSKREPSTTADRERKLSSAIAASSQPAPTAESPNYHRKVDRRQSSSAADQPQTRPVLPKTDSHKSRSSSNAPFPASGTTPTATEVRSVAPSVQDIQTGMIINPMNVPSHHRRPSVTATPEATFNVRPPTIPCAMPENNNLFTRSSPCPSCGALLLSPRSRASIISGAPHASQQLSDLLHLVCSRCSGTYCRGCYQPTSCSSKGATGCSVGLGTSSSSAGTNGRCSLQDCCSTISLIAIFEALSSFDEAYLAEVASSLPFANHSTPPTKAQRQTFLKQLISRPDKGTRKFEESFVRTTRILCSWLNQGSFSSDLVDLLCDLFLTSLLLEVIHAFLTHTVSARDWISHSDAYIALLDLLKKMHDAELYTLLNTPIPCIEHSRGLGEWVWNGVAPPAPRASHSIIPPNGLFLYDDDDDDDEFELEDYLQNRDHRRGRSQSHSQHRWHDAHATTYFSSSSASTSTSSSAASSALSSSSSSPRMAYLHLVDESQVGEPLRNPPLSDLILRLETHRKPLMALVGKVQFSATLEKVNILSDGISYLLLQQVVGIN